MNNVVSAIEARKNLGELLNRVLYRGEEIFVERKGKLVAKIVPSDTTVSAIPKKSITSYAGIWSTRDINVMKKAIKKMRLSSIRSVKPL